MSGNNDCAGCPLLAFFLEFEPLINSLREKGGDATTPPAKKTIDEVAVHDTSN